MATNIQVTATWILLIIYAVFILFFVVKGALRTRSMHDYALGSINFSPYFVGLSLAAAMTSAATFVINPGLIANYGISGVLSFGLFFPLATVVSLYVLSKRFRKYGQTVKAVSLASWIGARYNSKSYSLFIAFLSALLLTFIVLILVALSKVISSALNADEIRTLLVIVVFVFGYMMFGGANSMVYTNMVQAVVMVVVAIILLGSGFPYLKEGLNSFLERLAQADPLLIKATNPKSPLFRDFYEIAFAQMLIGIAVVCQPHIITKTLLLKKESDVNKFLWTAIIIQLLFFSVVITGLFARAQFPDLTLNGQKLTNDSIIPAYVVKVFSGGLLPIAIGLIVTMGLISAGLSTLEGLIQSLSSSIYNDIIKPILGINKIQSDFRQMLINRIVIAVMAVVAFFMAKDQLLNPKLSVAILAQNGVYAYFSIIFIPILLGIFYRDIPTSIPFIASVIAAITHFAVYYLLPWLHTHYDLSFGWFGKYLEGSVRNPAIAASTALMFSFVYAMAALYFFRVTRVAKPMKN